MESHAYLGFRRNREFVRNEISLAWEDGFVLLERQPWLSSMEDGVTHGCCGVFVHEQSSSWKMTCTLGIYVFKTFRTGPSFTKEKENPGWKADDRKYCCGPHTIQIPHITRDRCFFWDMPELDFVSILFLRVSGGRGQALSAGGCC